MLAERYSFSPRLLALMSEKPISTITTPAASTHRHTFDYQRAWKDTRRRKADLENHISLDEKPQTSTSDAAGLPGLGHYRIANEIWHYSSVDLGQECQELPNQVEFHVLIKARCLRRIQLFIQYPCCIF